MKLLSSVAVATIFTLLTACDSVSTAPSAAPVTLTDVQVSMFGFNGTFTSDGAVLLGRTFQMTANARFSNGGQDVTSAASWESSNPSVGPISPAGPPDRACYRHHGRHRDVSGEVRLASGDSLGHSVNLAVTHVATAAYHSRAR